MTCRLDAPGQFSASFELGSKEEKLGQLVLLSWDGAVAGSDGRTVRRSWVSKGRLLGDESYWAPGGTHTLPMR